MAAHTTITSPAIYIKISVIVSPLCSQHGENYNNNIYIKCDRLLKCFYFLVFTTGGIINLFSALHHLNASHHIVQTV